MTVVTDRYKEIEEIKGKKYVEIPEALVKYFNLEKGDPLHFVINDENSFVVKIEGVPVVRPS